MSTALRAVILAVFRLAQRLVLTSEFRRAHGVELTAVFAGLLDDAWANDRWLGVLGCTWEEFRTLVSVAVSDRREVFRRRRRFRRRRVAHGEPRKREMMGTLRQDVRYAGRTLRRSPGFAAVAALTIGLGVGANTAIFSVVYGVMLRPLPYHEPDRLVRAFTRFDGLGFERFWFSWPEYVLLREQNRVFEELGAYGHARQWNVSGTDGPEQVTGTPMSATVLPTLGVAPLVGRNFLAEEDAPGGPAVALLGYALWQRRFGGATNVVGRSFELNGVSRQIVGVMPPSFRLPSEFETPDPAEVWIPLALDPSNQGSIGGHNYNVVARLAAGASVMAADENVKDVTRYVRDNFQFPDGFSGSAVGLHEHVVGDIRPALLVLLGTVGFVLLIACANVANLMLARGESRQREIALRIALGAGRGRLIAQLLTESALLASLGGVVALALAGWGVKALLAVDPTSIPRADVVQLNVPVLAFTVVLSLVTGLAFGLVPALQTTRPDLQDSLKEGDRGATAGSRRQGIRRFLAVSEVALSLTLAIGAGLLIKSFQQLRSVDPGFDPENVVTMNVSLPPALFGDPADVTSFYERLLERTASLPGVLRAAVVSELPVAGPSYDWSFQIEGRPVPQGEGGPNADYRVVSTDYFRTVGMTLVRGETFTEADRGPNRPVVVINETMAERFWPGEDALGQRISLFGNDVFHEVIGIVRDVRSRGLAELPRPEMFVEHRQFRALGVNFTSFNVAARTATDPLSVVGAIRATVLDLDPDIPVARVQTVEQLVHASVAQERFSMALLSVFAGLALVLAAIGIYGVMSYTVAQRTHEIGIRLALGANRRAVRRLIVGQGMRLAGIGLAVGLVLAFGVTRVVETMLYGVSATDPTIFVGVVIVLTLVAFIANFIPAFRASRGDPVVALRREP